MTRMNTVMLAQCYDAFLDRVHQRWPITTSLFHLRLLELQPFAARTNTLVRLLSSFYVLRAGFPPIIPLAEEQSAYREVIRYAFQMITQPSVELFARWLLAAYSLIGTEQEEPQ